MLYAATRMVPGGSSAWPATTSLNPATHYRKERAMTTDQQLATLRGASQLIYDLHTDDSDPEYQFWCTLANLFGRAAETLDEGLGEMRNWDKVTWNVTLSAAQNYLAVNGA